jgi:hypothetical protein
MPLWYASGYGLLVLRFSSVVPTSETHSASVPGLSWPLSPVRSTFLWMAR